MPKTKKQQGVVGATQPGPDNRLPPTTHTGVNAGDTKTVLVSALLEVTGQVRYGDGTDIATTVTEKDTVLAPNGETIEKAIWAGTKRRGVDRRTIHELRDRSGWDGRECYIPKLCGMCPICWLFGFTGTTQEPESLVKNINAKSRILYATSVSIEDASRCLNRHSRNQVDEKSQTTAGVAGIHEEEVIVAGTHFPTYTSLLHVLDWEIGAVAHAFLENLNANRYTAASRAQGGIRIAERAGEPALVVDESLVGVFPLPAPKVPAWETGYAKAIDLFLPQKQSPVSLLSVQEVLQTYGFVVESGQNKLTARAGTIELLIEAAENFLVVHQGPDELMKRYYGNLALGYLRHKQLEAQKKLADSNFRAIFKTEVQAYAGALQKKGEGKESPGSAAPEGTTGDEKSAQDEGSSGDE